LAAREKPRTKDLSEQPQKKEKIRGQGLVLVTGPFACRVAKIEVVIEWDIRKLSNLVVAEYFLIEAAAKFYRQSGFVPIDRPLR